MRLPLLPSLAHVQHERHAAQKADIGLPVDLAQRSIGGLGRRIGVVSVDILKRRLDLHELDEDGQLQSANCADQEDDQISDRPAQARRTISAELCKYANDTDLNSLPQTLLPVLRCSSALGTCGT